MTDDGAVNALHYFARTWAETFELAQGPSRSRAGGGSEGGRWKATGRYGNNAGEGGDGRATADWEEVTVSLGGLPDKDDRETVG